MPLVLTPRTAADRGPLSIDLEGLTPARVAPLALTAINRLVIRADGRPCELGSLFGVAGDPADAVIECRGDFSRVTLSGPPEKITALGLNPALITASARL